MKNTVSFPPYRRIRGGRRPARVGALCGLLLFALPLADGRADARDARKTAFDDLCLQLQRGKGDVSESNLVQVLRLARELGAPHAAAAAVKSYSATHPHLSQPLQLLAAENALLAGDLRAAVARYRAWLAAADAQAAAADVAATLLTILLDYLNAEDEAYLFAKTDGAKFRQSDAFRKFDLWFLDTALKKGEPVEAAKFLNRLGAENLPLARERYYYWDYLTELMQAVKRPTEAHYPLAPHLKTLLDRFRGDPLTLLHYRFLLAHLDFKAAGAGKSTEALEAAFGPVAAAAQAWFDAAPKAATLQAIEETFSAGFQPAEWQLCAAPKRAFFLAAFAKLSDADRQAMIVWRPAEAAYMASPEQWTALCIAHPAAFARAGQFVYLKSNPDVYRQQAPHLAGVATPYAAIVNAMAAGTNLEDCARHLLDKESWHLDPAACYGLIANELWPIFNSFPRAETAKLPPDYYPRFLLRFGSATLMKTPVPLWDPAAAAAFVSAAWEAGERTQLPETLRLLDWAPYTEKERAAVFEPAYKQFREWSGKVSAAAEARTVAQARIAAHEKAAAARKTAADAKQAAEAKAAAAAQAAAAPDATDALKTAAAQAATEAQAAAAAWNAADAQSAQTAGAAGDAKAALAKLTDVPEVSAAQLTAIETAFKAALDPKSYTPDKAPTPLCKNVALALAAARDKKAEAFVTAARALYQDAKDTAVAKTPFGFALLKIALANRLDAFDTFAFQLEAFTNQLAAWTPTAPTQTLTLVHHTLIAGRAGWPSAAAATERETVGKFNAAMEKALLAQLDNNQFWPPLFDWFRETRRGGGWQDDDAGLVVMGKLIQQKRLAGIPYRLDGITAACTYMWLVRNEFVKLKGQYPAESYFDDLYIEECARSNTLDFAYWNYGADSTGKVVNLATRLLQTHTNLPVTARAFGATNELWKWHAQCLRMPPAWRKEHRVDEGERTKLIALLDAAWGQTRCDEYARGEYYFTADADVATPEGRKAYFQKLAAYAARGRAVPERLAPPNLEALAKLTELKPEEADALRALFPALVPARWAAGRSYELLPPLLLKDCVARQRYTDWLTLTPALWKLARDLNLAPLYKKLTELAVETQTRQMPDLAAAISSAGLDIAGAALPDDARITLMGLRLKALVAIGGAIPVDQSDPRYPIFAAQNAYLAGNLQQAWETYLAAPDKVTEMFREIDPHFGLWLIEQNTEMKDFKRAEGLARAMMQWLDALPEGFDREIQARVMMAYAGIAFARQEYPKARALLERIVAAKEFEGTRARNEADLRIADVDRLTRNYDSAIARLEKLARRMDRRLQTESAYQLALIKYEQEDYAETARLLDQVFSLEPAHVAGRILQGNLNLKLKKYQSATDINVGLSSSQKVIVPGKPLRIHLDDRNLAVAGRNAQIEVRVWTDSGDEELLSLLLSGESKTRFEGQLPTTLALAAKADHVVQVLGNDKIRFDYSEKFKQANHITVSDPMTMELASDAVLLVSSGQIENEEDQQERAFERMMDQVRRAEALAATLAAGRTNAIVRPGNPIYVRVVDPDASTTAQKDTLAVKVSAYSGDGIPAVTLEETDGASGVFEGRIATAPAGALAYASDSNEGRFPFYAIATGDYPPWVGLSDNQRPKAFSVDLNDNVRLGVLRIVADTAGRKLKTFYVQRSFNNRDFVTVGAWPTPHQTWDGAPGFEFVAFAGSTPPQSLDAIRRYIEADSVGRAAARAIAPMSQMAAKDNAQLMELKSERLPVAGDMVAGHFRAAFYQPARQTRTFKLDPKGALTNIAYYFALDGQEPETIATRATTEPIIRRALKKGAHVLDVYFFCRRPVNARFELLCDSDAPPYMTPCPATLFDPKTVPDLAAVLPDRAAAISNNADQTVFDVAFAPDTRARVIRLILADFETDAPALRKIALTDADGKALLPTASDFAAAGKNQTLEIVAGDKIGIAYTDAKVITPGKEIQERTMSANYHNAVIYPCIREEGQFQQLCRFVPGEKFDVLIEDPDCDLSDQADTVSFTVKTPLGKPLELKALEIEPPPSAVPRARGVHSGRFLGSVFTVKGPPARPNDLAVEAEENVVVAFHDQENTEPGIPWQRTCVLQQVTHEPPQLRVYEVTSLPLDEKKLAALRETTDTADKTFGALNREEYVQPSRDLVASRPAQPATTNAAHILSEGPLLVELVYPAAALSSNSVTTLYAQPLSAHTNAAMPPDGFDPALPGTVKLTATPREFDAIPPPPGYLSVLLRGDPYASTPLNDGRFSFVVEKAFGHPGARKAAGAADAASAAAFGGEKKPVLYVQHPDEIVVGFPFRTPEGLTNWVTQRVVMTSDVFVDVMDRFYRRSLDSIFVGEQLYVRINHRARDGSPDKDAVTVALTTSSGFATNLTLSETFERTGSFKGVVKPVYFEDRGALEEPGAIPTHYGDTITVSYPPADGAAPVTRTVLVHKGADGAVIPFTKQFKDPEVAARTQFTAAEAYFELAKKHRTLDQDSLARREIAQGKKLLEEAIRDYPNMEARAQADYLLADLALEFSNDAADAKIKREKQLEAITLFTKVSMDYPDSLYAPKAQYKKALTFEKMGEIDHACEEYVKLSYLYPDNELVAETIARLGNYFSSKGKDFEAKAKAATTPEDKKKQTDQAKAMFKTAADVFSRLAPRFPTHELSGKTLVLGGQCYMRAEEYRKAARILETAIATIKNDNDLVAEAMYWRADAFMKLKDFTEAYKQFKKLTWDYPASKWAKFARGRLTEPALDAIAQKDATEVGEE